MSMKVTSHFMLSLPFIGFCIKLFTGANLILFLGNAVDFNCILEMIHVDFNSPHTSLSIDMCFEKELDIFVWIPFECFENGIKNNNNNNNCRTKREQNWLCLISKMFSSFYFYFLFYFFKYI